jgi:NADPH:quinone reductase-like Zn-dependent oxidoreductase
MKVLEVQKGFGLDHLVFSDRPQPRPGSGEVLLRMKAASLNYRDLLTVQGFYSPKQPLPLIPGSDGIGEVVETGDGVSRVKKGDRVATTFFQGWISGEPTIEKAATSLGGPLDGVLTEYKLVKEDGVVHVPEHLSDEQAATLPCAALTAWNALAIQGRVKAGQTVLVQGTGGVALFSLQFAKLMGARVILISSSDEKLERARTMGMDHGINYRQTPRWGKAVKEITGGIGVDHIIELGGAGTMQESLQAVRLGGEISLIGVLAGPAKELNITPILMRNIRVQGILVGNREYFESMNRAIAHHRLQPVVDRIFPFEETRKGFELMAGAGHFGKICISIG